MLILVGSAETLLDDSVRLAGVAGATDVRVTLEVGPDMIHGWHLFYPELAAGRRGPGKVGAFIRSMLGRAGAAALCVGELAGRPLHADRIALAVRVWAAPVARCCCRRSEFRLPVVL